MQTAFVKVVIAWGSKSRGLIFCVRVECHFLGLFPISSIFAPSLKILVKRVELFVLTSFIRDVRPLLFLNNRFLIFRDLSH